MRVIQTSVKNKRNPRRRRALTTHNCGFSKVSKFEEFEDINLVDLQTFEHNKENVIKSKCEAASVSSPKGAFDIVSEYLNHSTHRGRSTGSTNRITTFVSSPVSEIYNLCNPNDVDSNFCENTKINASDCGKGRGKKQIPSTRRSSSRSRVKSDINSFLVFKRVRPLSEVNTNVLIHNHFEIKPLSMTVNSLSMQCQNTTVLEPKSVISTPSVKTQLANDRDERPPSPANMVTTYNIPINTTLTEVKDFTGTDVNQVADEGGGILVPSPEVNDSVTQITPGQASEPTPNISSELCSINPSDLLHPTPTESAQDSTSVLSDVHALIKCTALAGSELVENHGLANPSVISHVSSTVLPSSDTFIPVQQNSKRIGPKGAGRPRSSARSRHSSSVELPSRLTKYATIIANTSTTTAKAPIGTKPYPSRHPFMHFWESEDDHVSISRGWRTRRSVYLSMLLECTEEDDVAPDVGSGRNARRRSSEHFGHLLLHGFGKADGAGGVYARHLLEDSNSSLLLTESAAQKQKMLSALEPTVLGYRWPGVTNTASTEANREVMLLWN